MSCSSSAVVGSVKSSIDQVSSPDLSISPRVTNALDGGDIVHVINNLPHIERSSYILNEVLHGNVPEFFRKLVPVSVTIENYDKNYELIYFVSPEYLVLGAESDFFICPTTPSIAQRIANELDCLLPTKKMVDQIYMASAIKMIPQPIPPDKYMTTVAVFDQHNEMIREQRNTRFAQFPLGSLLSGHKKDIIISNKISHDNVVIYGWHTQSNKPIQPVYGGHLGSYVDYSHGVRLIHKYALVNGKSMLIKDILRSSTLSFLLSDEGPILKPYYPINQ